MDWNTPGIGFGKAGNNPYQWLGLAGSGLQSLMSATPTYDPEAMQTQQFERAAMATGKPVSEMPYQPHGLLPLLASKIGLMPTTMHASPDVMNREALLLREYQQQQAQQKLANMKDMINVITSTARYAGPKMASYVYADYPKEMQIPGITPEDIAKITTPAENVLATKEAQFEQNMNLKQQGIDIAQQKADVAQQIADLRGAQGSAKHSENLRKYTQMLEQLRARQAANMADPVVAQQINTIIGGMNNDENPDDAWKAAMAIQPPQDGGDGVIPGLSALLGHLFGATSPVSASKPATGAIPAVVKPDFTTR